jgi:hypothetical protein
LRELKAWAAGPLFFIKNAKKQPKTHKKAAKSVSEDN